MQFTFDFFYLSALSLFSRTLARKSSEDKVPPETIFFVCALVWSPFYTFSFCAMNNDWIFIISRNECFQLKTKLLLQKFIPDDQFEILASNRWCFKISM